jgi:hypothetical protein
MANTFANIIGAVALLLLVLWGGFSIYDYVRSDNGGLVDKAELDEAQKMYDTKTKAKLESELGPVIDEMAKEVLAKPKTKRKPKSVVTIDFTDAKGMNEIDGVIRPIAEGRVKVSVQNPKVMGEYQLNNKEKVRKSLIKNKK